MFYNYFMQPSFAIIEKDFEVVFTLRVDYLKRYKTEFSNSSSAPSDFEFAFLNYDSYLFYQPGFTVKLGFKYFKFQLQATKSNPFNNKYGSIYGMVYNSDADVKEFDHPVRLGSGITVDLEIFKKKKSKIDESQ